MIMPGLDVSREDATSSPIGRGGAGVYIEGELGAFYLLAMLAATEPRGLPGALLTRVGFQGADRGFALDDVILHGASSAGDALLEIQSKRTITFASKDRVFKEVCEQIVRSLSQGANGPTHRMAVATQRTSHSISGPYQDVLEWARSAESGAAFFRRLMTEGVAGASMRTFAETFRANLVEAGFSDDDEAVWKVMRGFLILEFDFESSAPLARTHALILAWLVLAVEDSSRTDALWTALIAISIETAKSGGSVPADELHARLRDQGFRLAGQRNFGNARAKLAEFSRQALAEIGTNVAGVSLPRTRAVEALDGALDGHRFVQLRGTGGVGKSAVFKTVTQRMQGEAHVFVLDPLNTPEGGWSALALQLGLTSTAREFLGDLASSGGCTLFIDSLEMFVSPARQRTINDLLREVAAIDGFSVVATARTEFGADGEDWLAADAVADLGVPAIVLVGDLHEDEVETLRRQAPELRALLAPGHPAAEIARNLYRLARLLRVPAAATIRSEAALADSWWRSGDYAPSDQQRAAQRLIADLADASLTGRDVIELRADSPSREHLLRSQTLSESRRDHLGFYHDVLRDWAVGARLREDPAIIAGLDLRVPVSSRIARGVEFAARFTLEMSADCQGWLNVLARLSTAGAHGSWRRHALLAIVRSELSPALLERCSGALLSDDGELLIELTTAIVAVETTSLADLTKGLSGDELTAVPASTSLRLATTPSGWRLLGWCLRHAGELPMRAIGSVVKLVEIMLLAVGSDPTFGQSTAATLFDWLLQLDVRNADLTIPASTRPDRSLRDDYRRLVADLRTVSLLLSQHAPEQLKAYLRALAAEKNRYKVKEIRPLSAPIARAAPQELADLIAASLIEPEVRGRHKDPLDRALTFDDSDYIPPSPAQPPFLDLLEASPEVGLGLIRKLVDVSVKFRASGKKPGENGFELVFDEGPRFFPWTDTYFWSRDQAHEYSMASGLMALEAWAHGRIEAGENIATVLKDVLGPIGSPAAYLLVAVDLLISHWPASRDLLIPFVSCPELLAIERQRQIHDGFMSNRSEIGEEPKGRVRLADLRARPSRRAALEQLLSAYSGDDEASNRSRMLLDRAVSRIGSYGEMANFADPAFMGAHARNILDPANWTSSERGPMYRIPREEAEHLARLDERRAEHLRTHEIEARIQLATRDAARGSAEVAQEAAAYAQGAMPDESEPDYGRTRSTRLAATAMLVARDGNDALLGEHEAWVRDVLARTLAKNGSQSDASTIAYNRQALTALALIYLWRRRGLREDRNALLALAARSDRSGALAFAAALDVVTAADARLIKSVIRIGFKSSCWRWLPWNEDPAKTEVYNRSKRADDGAAVEAEIAWLDGAAEPAWPAFPDGEPTFRRVPRIRVREAGVDEGAKARASQPEPAATVRVNSQTAALWLGLVTDDAPRPPWASEVVDAYADWSANANGFGQPLEAEIDQEPTEWNGRFYQLVATELMTGEEQHFR